MASRLSCGQRADLSWQIGYHHRLLPEPGAVMKAFLEYIPLLMFLLLYKLDAHDLSLAGISFSVGGIYSATAVLMASTIVVYGWAWIKDRTLSRLQWIVVGAVLVFGSSTLLFRSEQILMWKAPVVNWIMAAIFLGSEFIGPSPMAKTMFGALAEMPEPRWRRLNRFWVGVFLLSGFANLYVALNYPAYWVDFKVFGGFGIILLASLAQIVYLYPYLEQKPSQDESPR
jgi:intracellular septation protein